MTSEERSELFAKMFDLDEHQKDLILSRIFGYIEDCQTYKNQVSPERFFNIIKEKVEQNIKA